jgi:hypothetical protein
MSLKPDDKRSSRSRSKSGSRDDRDRSRSRSNVRTSERVPEAPSPPKAPRNPYPPTSAAPPAPYGNGVTSPASYDVRSPTGAGAEHSGYFGRAPQRSGSYGTPSAAPYPYDEGGYVIDYKDLPPEQRPGYAPPAAQFPAFPPDEDGLAYGDITSPNSSRQTSFQSAYPPDAPSVPYPAYPPQPPTHPTAPSYQYHTPQPAKSDSRSSSYTYQYAQVPSEITYTAKPQGSRTDIQHTQTAQGSQYEQLSRNYGYEKDSRTYEVSPGYGKDKLDRNSTPSKRVSLSVNTSVPGGLDAPRSPGGLTAQTSRLSVGGPPSPGGLPPPSPLLEPYHGTYQQMSPLPLILRPKDDEDDLDMLEPLSPQATRSTGRDDKLSRDAHSGKSKTKKSVVVHDSEDEAKTLSKALSGRTVDTAVIIDTLPTMSHDQIAFLVREYKKQVKVQGKGVNLSKHIKTKITGNFGKVAYVTALGRWASEGYWANFFYQSHSSRRELLIEALMGRTNGEIWNIKDEFKDKRYSDNLVKCMEQELKMDKFRTAVLMVLEERRQEEQDVYPVEYRNRDVEMLHKALTASKGGESTMLEIIVRRSDSHLRAVLQTYERMYQENFSKAALKKSNNMVVSTSSSRLNGHSPANHVIGRGHCSYSERSDQ